MRHIIIFLIFLLPSLCVSQTAKNNFRLSGNTAFSAISQKSNNTFGSGSVTFYTLDASAGYFVTDGLTVGVEMSGFGTDNGGNGFFVMGPEVRYYTGINVLLASSYLFDFNQFGNVGEFVFKLGYAAFLNEKVSLEPLLVYSNVQSSGTTASSFGLNIGLSVFLGKN